MKYQFGRWANVGALALLMSGCVAEIDGGDLSKEAEVFELVTERSCATDGVLASNLEQDPDLYLRMEEIEAHTEQVIESRALSGSTIIIPTVVHVVYNTASQNISDAQIQSQIDVLNKDFRRTNTDANNTWAQAADVNIEFFLAGVSRTQTTKTSFGTNDSIKFTSQGGRDVYQPQNYLNIWVGRIGNSILGYAQFPGGSASTDGVVIDPQYFGTTGTAVAPFNLGRTTTHEVGHWLNLRHIWGDTTSCGTGTTGGDFVADTPAARNPNYGCTPTADSCSGESRDMVENYMDYSDDACMNLFTAGQKARMQALFAAGGVRESLKNAPLTPVNFGGGTTPPPPQYSVIDTRASQSASANVQTAYGPYSTVGASAIKFELSGGTGDADLYVKFGSAPTLQSYDCRPYLSGNAEKCEFNPSQSGNYYVMVHAYSAYSGLTLTVSRAGGTTTSPEVCTDGVDNDGDGAVDCNDSDCNSASACQPDPEVCDDGVDNDGDGAADCNDSDCASVPACGTGGAEIVSQNSFLNGFGSYIDGGTNARALTSTTKCFSDGKCIELRGGTSSSNVSTPNINLSAYNEIEVSFNFYNTDFETGESLVVEISTNGGSTWTAVANFVKGSGGFTNGGFGASVPVTRSSIAFSSNTRVRFRSNASSTSSDNIYVDDVVITAQ